MKKLWVLSGLVVLLVLFYLFLPLPAAPAGGRGGGGVRGGGGAASRAAGGTRAAPRPNQNQAARMNQNMNRTPSMSRPPVSRPPANARRQAPPSQLPPSRQQPPVQRMPVQQRPTYSNQARARAETRQFSQGLRTMQGNTPRKMQPPKNFNHTFQNQIRNNAQASSKVAGNVRQRFPHSRNWFTERFFDTHRSYDFFRDGRANWWWAPAWGTVATWFPWGWSYPYYYYYPGYVDYGYPPASDLYLQLQGEALSEPPPAANGGVVQTDAGEWMPLGVFAAGVSEADAAYSNFFVQLAVNNAGDIAGTYYNAATDESHPLGGNVDQKTQQAIWKVSDNPNSPVMMTGLYNLTQEMTPVQVYFANEVQEWVLVRIKQ